MTRIKVCSADDARVDREGQEGIRDMFWCGVEEHHSDRMSGSFAAC